MGTYWVAQSAVGIELCSRERTRVVNQLVAGVYVIAESCMRDLVGILENPVDILIITGFPFKNRDSRYFESSRHFERLIKVSEITGV